MKMLYSVYMFSIIFQYYTSMLHKSLSESSGIKIPETLSLYCVGKYSAIVNQQSVVKLFMTTLGCYYEDINVKF